MGWYDERVLPRLLDLMLRGKEYASVRSRVAAGLAGEVLEIGFGSGLNVPHYPAELRRVLAVDPAVAGRKLAAARVAASPAVIEYIGLDGQALPVPDASVDHALSTWTLCTIPDAGVALSEIRRVLRPGGALHFAEHGLAPAPKVARRQHKFTPLQKRVFGGCHLDRDIGAIVTAAGFELTRLDNYYLRRPRMTGYTYEGVATRA